MEDITFSFLWHHVPNEDNYFVQQFRQCKFAIFKVEFMFDIWSKKKGGTGCPYPTCSFGNSFLHVDASLLLKYSPYGHDSSKTYPEDFIVHKDNCWTDI